MLRFARRGPGRAEVDGVTSDDTQPFSEQLRRLRDAAGLTQEELAERAGLSVKAVSALERGRRQRPYPHTVRALADALGLSEDERAELAGTLPKRERQADAAPAARPLLPGAPTSLIGREHELDDIVDVLRGGDARLMTLTGPGGVGKTRLALEAASRLSAELRGNVGFVPLAPLGDPSLVLPAVAQALGFTESGTTSARELLAARLASQQWLVVLDNVEHVLDSAPEIADLLAACPTLTILVTSRAPLRIRAEHEYLVRPLALPDLSHVPTVDEVAGASSVQLFVERARAASPDFELTQANCAAVAAVCRRLDGLPLALELVAARVRVLSPTELLARLDQLLPLLVGGSRDLPERQQTMRAAINWSYELLDPAERALFRRLSVFVGGWVLDAAEAAPVWGEIAAEDVIELLSGLVEQSLVVAETGQEGATRYRMLEPIRQFAAQRLDEAGETGLVSDRHLDWSLALARRGAEGLRGAEQQHWLERLEQEHDNLRAALRWSEQDSSRANAGLQLATALWRFWSTRGHLTEGRRWLESALEAGVNVTPGLRADALNAAGILARAQGDHERASALYDASLALRRELGDRRAVGMSLNNLGTVSLDRGEYEQAARLFEESLALFRETATDWEVAIALQNIGIVLGYRGEYARAAAQLEEALDLWRRLGETDSQARSLDALGEVWRKAGDIERATGLHEASLALRRELRDTRGSAITLRNLGVVARLRGDYPEARRLLDESLALNRQVGDKRGEALTTAALADLARAEGEGERALALYAEAISTQRRIGINEGLAECLLGMAAIVGAGGDALRGARLLGVSDALRERMGQAIAPVERVEYERVVSGIADALGAEAFEAARAEGRDLALDEALG